MKDPKSKLTSSSKTASAAAAKGGIPRNQCLLLMVKVLFVLVILFLLPKLVTAKNREKKKQRKKTDLEVRSLRQFCAQQTCLLAQDTTSNSGRSSRATTTAKNTATQVTMAVAEESMNCVMACMSPACFEEVGFGQEPLEDGEIDLVRTHKFDDCVKNEIRLVKKWRVKNGIKQNQFNYYNTL